MIIERTEYYARPGMAGEVLAIRRRACAVRRDLGLSAGQVFTRRHSSDAETPDVVWECAFASGEEQERDLAARGDSPAFSAVRAEMSKHLAQFRRHVVERDPEPLANGMRPVDLRGNAIVPRQIRFRGAEHELMGYFFHPPGQGPFPCLITNHGSGIHKGTLDVSRPGTAALLMSWGIASFLPHRHGYGHSDGPAWRAEVSTAFGTPEYDKQIVRRLDRESEDVIAALGCVSALPEVRSDHIGVMGSSFGGINTLLAASKSDRFTCAVEFAGAAMNWDKTPQLRRFMIEAAHRVAAPIFFIQAENDYSIRPTKELAAELAGTDKVVWSKIYPPFGCNADEGHLLERAGQGVWGDDVRLFLERYL